MADARKRAEEVLANLRTWCGNDRVGPTPITLDEIETLLALLAEEPEAPDFIRCAVPRGECCHQRIPTVLPLEAPECNDGDDCCRYCGRGLQPCGACKPASLPPEVREAVAPSEDQVREFAYYLGGDRAVAAIEAVPAPAPLPPEVREALLAEVPPMSAATPGGFHTRAKEWLARRDTVGHLAETPEVGIIRALLADNDVAAKRVPCGDPDCLCGISPEVHAPQKGVPE